MKENINKKIIFILFFIVVILISVNIITLIDRNKMKKEIEVLNTKKEIKGLSSRKENEQNVKPMKQTAYLRGLGHVKLHFLPTGHPTFGYKADVNTFVWSDDNKVEIIEGRKGWSRININGWIPSWYLSIKLPTREEIEYLVKGQKRTVNKDTRLYLTPEDNSEVIGSKSITPDKSAAELYAGQIVELVYKYEEWYYVKRYVLWDANNYREGWVKKSDLSTFEELKPDEVMIRKGTLIYGFEEDDKKVKLDENIYGRILSYKDGWYEIVTPGAGYLRVKEKDVTHGN